MKIDIKELYFSVFNWTSILSSFHECVSEITKPSLLFDFQKIFSIDGQNTTVFWRLAYNRKCAENVGNYVKKLEGETIYREIEK